VFGWHTARCSGLLSAADAIKDAASPHHEDATPPRLAAAADIASGDEAAGAFADD